MRKVHDAAVFPGTASGHAAVATDLLLDSRGKIHHDTRFALDAVALIESQTNDLRFEASDGILK